MDLQELMDINANDLAKKQAEHLQAHIVETLQKTISLVEAHDFEALKEKTVHSPAGDGYGCNNNFIDFSYYLNDDGMDIIEITDLLKNLLATAKTNDWDDDL